MVSAATVASAQPTSPATAAAPSRATPTLDSLWQVLESVPDPEIPVVSVVELGIVRNLEWDAADPTTLIVRVTPTYSGCPAMEVIAKAIQDTLKEKGIEHIRLATRLAPAWTTDWMSEDGRRKLREYGIAPPQAASSRRALFGVEQVACPQCGSIGTELLSEFGSTSCKALWRCKSCREPFDYFKCH